MQEGTLGFSQNNDETKRNETEQLASREEVEGGADS
jgi:hypothetical protein